MEEPVQYPPPEEGHLLDFLIVLVKYSRSILLVSVAATVFTYLVLFVSPNQYTARTCILPPQTNASLAGNIVDSLGIVNSPASAGGLGYMGSMLGLKSPGDLYVGMMESDGICDRIIRRFNLRKVYKEDYIENVRRTLRSGADIKCEKEGLISIKVMDEDPVRAANLANAFAEELDNVMQEISRTEAKNYLVFLDHEKEKASLRLANAEEALRTFSEKSSVIQIDSQTKGMIEYIANLRATIDAKEVQKEILQKRATPRNYDMINLDTEIKGLKEKLRSAETQREYVGDVCLGTSKVPNLTLEYMRLFREAKFRENIYQLYGRLLELAHIDAVRNVGMIQYVNRATVPERRSNRRLMPSLLAGFVVFFMMIGLSFVRDYSEKIKTNEEDAQRLAIFLAYLQPYTQAFAKVKDFFKRKKSTD
jgi:tyrosine-protein kinase Etk/Wzc